MKKNYFLKQLLLLLFIVGVASCKKDTKTSIEENVVNQNDISKIKKWYDDKKLTETGDWEKASFNENEKKYHIPIKTKMQLSSALLTNELVIANSIDKNATFVYKIVKDKIKYKSEENSILKAVLDTDNHFVSGEYSRDGVVVGNVEIKQTVLTNNNTEFSKEGWATAVDVPCGQTVYNGFIVYDLETGQVLGFLIVSEVNGFCPPSGGEAGGGNTTLPPVIDCSNAQAFLSSILYSTSPPFTNYYMGPITTGSNGIIRRTVSPIGAAHHFNFIFGMQATYKAHFTGIIYKNNISDPTWKWQSFAYAGFYLVSGALPANASAIKTEGGVSTAISGDKKLAQCSGYVQMYFAYSCLAYTYNGFVNNCYVGYNYHAHNEVD